MSLLTIYKSTLSWVLTSLFGGGCRHLPTCSEYAVEAVSAHGVAKGTVLAARRLLRCHPWGSFGSDPVPPKPNNS